MSITPVELTPQFLLELIEGLAKSHAESESRIAQLEDQVKQYDLLLSPYECKEIPVFMKLNKF